MLDPEEVKESSRIDGLARGKEGKQAKSEFLSTMSIYIGCHQKVWPRLRTGPLTSNNPVKKSLAQVCPLTELPCVTKETI